MKFTAKGAFRLPFGKHRGKVLADIDPSYLKWCLSQDWLFDDVRKAISEHLKIAEAESATNGQTGTTATATSTRSEAELRGAVKTWYRRLAMQYHPDRCGDDREMKVVNQAYDELVTLLGLD